MSTLTQTAVAIREASRADWLLLAEMYDDFEAPTEPNDLPPRDSLRRAQWLEGLRQGVNLVAADGDRIAGHLVLMPSDVIAEIAVFVHPEYRRNGVAWTLCETAIELASEHGIRSLWMLISSNNLAASRGLREFGFHTVWQKDGQEQLVMRV
jgi:ribosomal protein S18 acetylase RimI-like enzyme